MKNEDQKCFKWCITRALNPVKKNAERITKDLREQSKDLCWKGIDFPVELDKIGNFERRNDVSVNVFGFENIFSAGMRCLQFISSLFHR